MIYRLMSQISAGDLDKVPQGDLTESTVSTVLQTVFAIGGGVALIVIVVAGLFYVISMGNPQSTAKAKNTIMYAIIGLAVCIFAYTIVRFVLNQI